MQTPFHAYYTAQKLNSLQDEDRLLPVYSDGNIKVYPYQVAAALFAMRNPYQKGVILCDEAGMGKSHEAMLAASEMWYEGKTKILIAIPHFNLLMQWAEMLDEKYSVPYCVAQNESISDFDGIVLPKLIVKADKVKEICRQINFPVEANERITLTDAFRNATGEIHDRIVETAGGEIKIYDGGKCIRV